MVWFWPLKKPKCRQIEVQYYNNNNNDDDDDDDDDEMKQMYPVCETIWSVD